MIELLVLFDIYFAVVVQFCIAFEFGYRSATGHNIEINEYKYLLICLDYCCQDSHYLQNIE
jgi:hypothetical protein